MDSTETAEKSPQHTDFRCKRDYSHKSLNMYTRKCNLCNSSIQRNCSKHKQWMSLKQFSKQHKTCISLLKKRKYNKKPYLVDVCSKGKKKWKRDFVQNNFIKHFATVENPILRKIVIQFDEKTRYIFVKNSNSLEDLYDISPHWCSTVKTRLGTGPAHLDFIQSFIHINQNTNCRVFNFT